MDINKFKFTRLQEDLFEFLSDRVGEKLTQREISKGLNVSPTAISNSVGVLLEAGLVVIERFGKMKLTYLEFNRDSEDAINLKRVYNLKKIYLSKLNFELREKFPGSTIILFGSYSRGEDIISSDIDIAIIASKEKNFNLNKYENFLSRKIIINFYPSLKDIHKNLRENILNGIVLSGGIEL